MRKRIDDRVKVSLYEFMSRFETEQDAMEYIESLRWANNASQLFGCEVEVDETYIGGNERSLHKDKKLNAGRGTVGKIAIFGIKERNSKKIKSFKVVDTKAITLHQIVCDSISSGSTVYTEDATTYEGLERYGYKHETVRHLVCEFVKDQAHTNGAESFWSYLKRGYYGICHKMSPKHLQKYVEEFSARQNVRALDTMVQIDSTICGLFGKRFNYTDLVSGSYGRLH